ncbi:Fis family transcriptional regulator [Sulfurospirillum sp. 1307]
MDILTNVNFIANSRASKEALKSANLLKSLNINAIILGESGVGKLTLSKFIMPEAVVADGNNFKELLNILDSNSKVIIKDFNKISNFKKIKSIIEKNSIRIIATSSNINLNSIIDDFFSLKITIPPLSERQEDIEALAHKFLEEVSSIFGKKDIDISFENLNFDLSENCYSLRRSIYLKYLVSTFKDEDILQIMEEFLYSRLGGRNDYRDNLYLYEIPIIKSGFKKFKSQLNMSEKLGLNRNTLRKKVLEYKDKL